MSHVTAELMDDYQLPANLQQIILNSTQASVCFNVTIVDDSNVELTECVTLMAVVSNASIMAYTVTIEEIRICIRDNDGGLLDVGAVLCNEKQLRQLRCSMKQR